MITHRTALQPAWWLFGIGLAAAAWWGQPLLQVDRFENHFFGVFWYSMLALATVFWAFPAEQRATAQTIERHYRLLGLITLWQHVHPVSEFEYITLDQEPGLFGRDSVWLLFQGKDQTALVFARYRANEKQIMLAQAQAEQLSTQTGLPFKLNDHA